MQLSRSLTPRFMLACFFFKSRSAVTSNTQQQYGSHGSDNGWRYSTGLVYVLHRNEQLEGEHGGRTSYMYPRPNVTRQDMGHRVYKHTTTEY